MSTYPRPPYDPYAVPDSLDEVWATAWGHIGYIEWLMLGDASPQLISGHYRDCPTYDGGLCDGTCWIAYHKHQPYAHAQPVERFGRPPACTCRYDLRVVDGIAGTHDMDPFREGWRRGVYAFRIHPKCPHHGETRLVGGE